MHNNGNKKVHLVLYVQWSSICFCQQCGHREGYKIQRLDIFKVHNGNVKLLNNAKYQNQCKAAVTVTITISFKVNKCKLLRQKCVGYCRTVYLEGCN